MPNSSVNGHQAHILSKREEDLGSLSKLQLCSEIKKLSKLIMVIFVLGVASSKTKPFVSLFPCRKLRSLSLIKMTALRRALSYLAVDTLGKQGLEDKLALS